MVMLLSLPHDGHDLSQLRRGCFSASRKPCAMSTETASVNKNNKTNKTSFSFTSQKSILNLRCCNHVDTPQGLYGNSSRSQIWYFASFYGNSHRSQFWYFASLCGNSSRSQFWFIHACTRIQVHHKYVCLTFAFPSIDSFSLHFLSKLLLSQWW